MTPSGELPDEPSRSAFIDGLAWSTIIVGAGVGLLSLLVWAAFSMMDPAIDLQTLLAAHGFEIELPAYAMFIFKHMKAISMSLLAFCGVSIVCAIGLLRRRNWARVAFIVMLVLSIALNGVGVYFSLVALGGPMAMSAKAAMLINAVLIVVLSWMMVWMVKRLRTVDIKREFGIPAPRQRSSSLASRR
jgi:hypothetical protein